MTFRGKVVSSFERGQTAVQLPQLKQAEISNAPYLLMSFVKSVFTLVPTYGSPVCDMGVIQALGNAFPAAIANVQNPQRLRKGQA